MYQDVIAVATDASLELSLRQLLQDLSDDGQDSVRLLVAAACAPLAQRGVGKAGTIASVFPIFAKIAKVRANKEGPFPSESKPSRVWQSCPLWGHGLLGKRLMYFCPVMDFFLFFFLFLHCYFTSIPLPL